MFHILLTMCTSIVQIRNSCVASTPTVRARQWEEPQTPAAPPRVDRAPVDSEQGGRPVTVFILAVVIGIGALLSVAVVRAKNSNVRDDVQAGEDIEQMRALYLSNRRNAGKAHTSTLTRASHETA